MSVYFTIFFNFIVLFGNFHNKKNPTNLCYDPCENIFLTSLALLGFGRQTLGMIKEKHSSKLN